MSSSAALAQLRSEMVQQQLKNRDITDAEVLRAMGTVPRHEFVPERMRAYAYEDRPLPIGCDQTISQPYIVALMTQLSGVTTLAHDARVLEVGTGCGYQAAVLAEVGAQVWSIEIVEELAARAATDLARLGYSSVSVRSGDGYAGWPAHAPFDAIVVTAAPEQVPAPLVVQLRIGGRLVIPVGETGADQSLTVITRLANDEYRTDAVAPVRFVPMTGRAEVAG